MACTSSFVASEVCRICHISEFYSWQATDHAGAYVTLLQKDKHQDATCLPCHVSGYTMPGGYAEALADLQKAQKAARKLELQRSLATLEPDSPKRAALEKQLAELQPIEAEELAKLSPEELDKKLRTLKNAVDARKGVGCENCHGGARRHVAVALKDRTAIARAPYQRPGVSARDCSRCHHDRRPCLPADEADPFESEVYLKRIQHWP
jgi:hypothetical protein